MKVKNIVFCGAMASILAIGVATAADKSDVTFDGKYSLSTDTEGTMSGTIETEPTAGQFTYNYENYEGAQTGISSEHEIAYSEFKYTDSQEAVKELTEDFEPEAQENYTKEIEATRTVGDNLKVMTDVTTLVSGTDPVVANYTYQRGDDGDIKNLADQPTFTETRTLLSEVEAAYADKISISNGTETISVTNGTAETLDATLYTLNASNGQTYHLSSSGTDVLNQMGEIANPGEGLDEEFAALKQAYADDSTAIAGFVASTGQDYSTAAVDYEAALAVFEGDKGVVTTLNNNFASQATAQTQYNNAIAARQVAVDQFGASTENYNQAKSVYSSPILGTIDSEADSRIELALGEGGVIKTAIDEGDAATLKSAKSYADEQGAIALASANSYTDLKIAGEAAERASEDAKLRSAIDANRNDINALDSKVNELDENLSAGIASSVALSSVAVANVQKGEMSVGGGYGNYNSKSAVALGAALGITDNWSANAGVGLGFGSGSKASFRIGTNYKFKLF